MLVRLVAIWFLAAALGPASRAQAQSAEFTSLGAVEPEAPRAAELPPPSGRSENQYSAGPYFITAIGSLPGIKVGAAGGLAMGAGVASLWTRRWFVLRADLRLLRTVGEVGYERARIEAYALSGGLAGLAQFQWLQFGAHVRAGRIWADAGPGSPERWVAETTFGFGPTFGYVVRATTRVRFVIGFEAYVALLQAAVRTRPTGNAWLEPDGAVALTLGSVFGGR